MLLEMPRRLTSTTCKNKNTTIMGENSWVSSWRKLCRTAPRKGPEQWDECTHFSHCASLPKPDNGICRKPCGKGEKEVHPKTRIVSMDQNSLHQDSLSNIIMFTVVYKKSFSIVIPSRLGYSKIIPQKAGRHLAKNNVFFKRGFQNQKFNHYNCIMSFAIFITLQSNINSHLLIMRCP